MVRCSLQTAYTLLVKLKTIQVCKYLYMYECWLFSSNQLPVEQEKCPTPLNGTLLIIERCG